MTINRRQMILGAAGTATALVLTAGVWRVTRLPQSALAPWTPQPEPDDVRLHAFRHAILAPNPHNRQPWLIRLEGQDRAVISCDLDRRLPDTDPFDRQIVIGFGTFLEIARMAAASRGYRLEITAWPDGEPQPRLDRRPVAMLRFVAASDTPPDPLFAAVLRRHTNRLAYAGDRPVRPRDLARMLSAPDGFTVDPAQIAPLRRIAQEGIRTELTTPRTYRESLELMRIGHAEIDANPDGIALSGPMVEALALAGQLDRAALADPDSQAFRTGLDMQLESHGSIPALAWIVTPGNCREDQLEAGRRYVRAQLRATLLGLSMHPMSQALQEYAEVRPLYQEVHQRLTGGSGARVQMFARVGYASPVRPAPRWPMESHLSG